MSIEQSIRAILEKSKKTAETLDEQVGADKVGDGLKVAPGNTEGGSTEPNNARNVTNQSVKSNGQGVDGKGSADGKRDKAAKPAEKAPKRHETAPGQNEELEVDVSADVAALVEGEDLTEEFKTKAATIFEAAVVTRVKAEIAKLEEEFEARLEEQFEEAVEGLVEQVDGYLNLMVEQWLKDNELALESGLKAEITENFIVGLQKLFKESYIEVPEEKLDVLSALEEELAEITAKLDEQVAVNVTLNKTVSEMKKADLVSEAAAGLTDVEAEKFATLAEELVFESDESFKAKLQTIRESYFAKKPSGTTVLTETVVTDAPVIEEEAAKKPVATGRVAAYAAALEKFNK